MMEQKLSEETLSNISGGRLKNVDQLYQLVRNRKKEGKTLNQIVHEVTWTNYRNFSDGECGDVGYLMELTTEYYNQFPGRKGEFTIDGQLIDYDE